MEDQEKVEVPQYIRKPRSIVQDKRLTTTEGDYLALIGGLQNAGSCYASNGWFADYFAVSLSTAKTIIKRLREKRFIITHKKLSRGGKTLQRYIEVIDPVSKSALITNADDPAVEAVESQVKSPEKPQKQADFDGCPCNPSTPSDGLQNTPPMGYKPPPAMGYKLHPINNNIYKTKNNFLSLAELFLKYRQKVSPNCQVNLESWTTDFERIIRSGPERKTVQRAIRWISRDDCWWFGKITSPGQFETKLTKILDQMQDDDKWIDKACHFCSGDEDTVKSYSKKLRKMVYYHRECREKATLENKNRKEIRIAV